MRDTTEYLIKSFSKTTGLAARLYQNRKAAYYYSAAYVQPDPVLPELDSIFASPHKAGVITTPLFQHYGYVRLSGSRLFIVGPTAAMQEDVQKMDGMMFLLGVEKEKRQEYLRRLYCAPEVSAERLAWMLSYFVTSMTGRVFDVGEVHIATPLEAHREPIDREYASATFDAHENTELAETVLTSYRFERVANMHVKNGQVEQLRELFEARPRILAGKMAHDTLRQTKSMFICAATTVSRAAIDGGLDASAAFKLSDLYIQKSELMRDPDSIMAMVQEMTLDFAERVRELNYCLVGDSKLFEACALYVKKHLFSRILVKDMAEELGITSAYLSNLFHTQTGRTLTQFIQEQKIIEAKQLLQYADKSIADIAAHLAFSSQSHFQNAFKKQTGVTPLEYRRRARAG